jgi:hypothetical protein
VPDRFHLGLYPTETVEGTGIRLLTLPAEAAERLSEKLDIAKRIKILRRSALQGEASEEVFAQTHQSVGVDENGYPVFVVLSYLFARKSSPDRGGWFLAIVPLADQRAFEQYLEAAQRHKFAQLQKERASPFHLWTLRGPDYQAPYEEMLQVFTNYLITQYRPLWDALTPFKTLWHLARTAGLIGWSKFEAAHRLAKSHKTAFTLADFRALGIQEVLHSDKTPGPEIWAELVEIGASNPWKLSDYVKGSGYNLPKEHQFLCIAYDRHQFPLEFWRSQAISDYMPTCREWKRSTSAVLIRKWLEQVDLGLTQPSIIRGYNQRTGLVDFDAEAAHIHGLPTKE